MLPLWVLSRRLLLTTALLSLGVGALLIGLTSYVPTCLEGVLHVTPFLAGLTLAVLTIGWPIASTLAGRLYLCIGFRNTVLIGMVFIVGGTAALAALARLPSVILVALCCLVVGLGLGLVATPGLIVAQASVAWNERGVVTGTNLFAWSIGSAVGVAIFGAVGNAIIVASGASDTNPAAIESASASVFAAVAITAIATVAAALAMPRHRSEAAPSGVPES